jgi:hypothetical protein
LLSQMVHGSNSRAEENGESLPKIEKESRKRQ